MLEKLYIFGAGVRANVVVDLIAWEFSHQVEVEGYYEDRLPAGATGPGGFPVVGNVSDGLEHMRGAGRSAFVALGTRSSSKACHVFLTLQSFGVKLLSLISPTAHISPSAVIGQNALVLPGVFLGCEVKVGHMFCAHGGTVVEHHGQIGHNVLLAPGVAIASNVKVGSHTFLGTGCKIIPEKTVGRGSLLGAGSVVIRNIPDYVVAFGCPAVSVRRVGVGDEVPTEEDVRTLGRLGLE